MNDNNPQTDPSSWAVEQPTQYQPQQQYQAQPQYQEQYQPQYQQQYQPAPPPAYGYQMAAPQEKSGISGAMLGVIAFLVAVLLAVGAAIMYIIFKDSDPVAAAGGQTSTVVETVVQQAPSDNGATDGGTSKSSSGSGSRALAGGDLSNAWPGTSVTTGPFTENVRRAYVDYRNSTGAESGTITAYSPARNLNYDMWCRPEGSKIKCTGGNNAVVYIN